MRAGHICAAVLLPSAESTSVCPLESICLSKSLCLHSVSYLCLWLCITLYMCVYTVHVCTSVHVCVWLSGYPGRSKSICLSRIKMPETRKKERRDPAPREAGEGRRAKQMSSLELLTCLLVTFLLPDVQLVIFQFYVEVWPYSLMRKATRPMQMCYFLNIFGTRVPENGRDRQPDELRLEANMQFLLFHA